VEIRDGATIALEIVAPSRWMVESHPSLFYRAKFIERSERGNDLHAISGILFDLRKPLQHRDVFRANLFRQIVRFPRQDR
jgi:hypothetical protein